ncbi:GntR family transcriptional regulator [Streptacidiphilus rugosus]|uniref:GntR family transcriptional regulator n=1 Tax=Streptacidiphilus rugosus TaxID=405783 RepID=UPI0012FC85DC
MNISRVPGRARKCRWIAADLRQRIMDGEWRTGVPLPVEGDLENQYRIARHTVRLAVDNLEPEGLLVRGRGKGTRPEGHAAPDHHAYRAPTGPAAVTPSLRVPFLCGGSGGDRSEIDRRLPNADRTGRHRHHRSAPHRARRGGRAAAAAASRRSRLPGARRAGRRDAWTNSAPGCPIPRRSAGSRSRRT